MTSIDHTLWWAYENEKVACLAKKPSPLSLPGAKMAPHSPFRTKAKQDIHSLIVGTDYKVAPSDCGPYRLIASYGFVAYAPTDISIEDPGEAPLNITSIKWPFSENGYAAVPITGSDYIKLYTGIMVFFSQDTYLYQGPLPNALNTQPRVMSGMEYVNSERRYTVSNVLCGLSNLNVIIQKPPIGEILHIKEGQPLLWFFSLPKRHALSLEYLGNDT